MNRSRGERIPPELVQIGGTSETSREQRRPSVEIRKVRGFMKQKFPLSEAGASLKKELQAALEAGNDAAVEELSQQVPTVENPRTELYKDLGMSKEDRNRLFGTDLANVQVTKGCSRGCSHCAAGAGSKIEFMPFAAVVKIGKQKKSFEKDVQPLWEAWREPHGDLYDEELSRTDIVHPEDSAQNKLEASARVKERARSTFSESPLSQYVDPSKFDTLFGGVPRPKANLIEIANYYDSEAFDYRDSRFLHEDGSPADYADVVEQLSSKEGPVSITTAGWTTHNKVARKAAEKMVQLTKGKRAYVSECRVSVNPYTRLARSDPEAYLEEMKQVIDVLHPMKPKLLLFYERGLDADYTFWILVIRHLREYVEEKYPEVKMFQGGISSYSGAAAEQGQVEEHRDVMACMPGIHIWPDGTIARQAFDLEQQDHVVMQGVPKGSRPIPTGERLW